MQNYCLRTKFTVYLGVVGLLSTFFAHADNVDEPIEAVEQQVITLTNQLTPTTSQTKTKMSQLSSSGDRLARIAEQRQKQLLTLLERDPQRAALRMMPDNVRQQLSAEVRAYVESPVQTSGSVITLVSDDFAQHQSKSLFFLQPSTGGKPLQLHLAADTSEGQRTLSKWSGKNITLKAKLIEQHLLIENSNQVTTSQKQLQNSKSANLPLVQGKQKLLVILADYQDKPVECSASEVNNFIFGEGANSVKGSYLESSRSAVSFSGQVVGPYKIPYYSNKSCDFSGWASAAQLAVKNSGVDISSFTNISYVLPTDNTCGWAGLGSLGDGFIAQETWIRSCKSTFVFAHELGHNLGMNHAGVPGSDIYSAYGDNSDPMGNSGLLAGFNAPHLALTGWISSNKVKDVQSSNTYELNALELTESNKPQILRVKAGSDGGYYYVSLRQAIGLDKNLDLLSKYGLTQNHINTISIHKADLITNNTLLQKNLRVGETFSDAANKIEVRFQNLNEGTAIVAITTNGSKTCLRNPKRKLPTY